MTTEEQALADAIEAEDQVRKLADDAAAKRIRQEALALEWPHRAMLEHAHASAATRNQAIETATSRQQLLLTENEQKAQAMSASLAAATKRRTDCEEAVRVARGTP